jgi:hypothetical protein
MEETNSNKANTLQVGVIIMLSIIAVVLAFLIYANHTEPGTGEVDTNGNENVT